ncbi:hypothetical protein B0H19DRAFT_1338727 [Mycena capillaripes]|nr:hypothetical protein B0H19DRAFT_1338727 [Mycena capillaripes]
MNHKNSLGKVEVKMANILENLDSLGNMTDNLPYTARRGGTAEGSRYGHLQGLYCGQHSSEDNQAKTHDYGLDLSRDIECFAEEGSNSTQLSLARCIRKRVDVHCGATQNVDVRGRNPHAGIVAHEADVAREKIACQKRESAWGWTTLESRGTPEDFFLSACGTKEAAARGGGGNEVGHCEAGWLCSCMVRIDNGGVTSRRVGQTEADPFQCRSLVEDKACRWISQSFSASASK